MRCREGKTGPGCCTEKIKYVIEEKRDRVIKDPLINIRWCWWEFRKELEARCIRSSEKFLSFYKEIMNAQYFPFYIILSNYVWSISFYQDKGYNVWQIRFNVCIKMCYCKRKTLFGQPNRYGVSELLRSQTGQRYPSFLREFCINFLKIYKVEWYWRLQVPK